jgi:hypothetical protein
MVFSSCLFNHAPPASNIEMQSVQIKLNDQGVSLVTTQAEKYAVMYYLLELQLPWPDHEAQRSCCSRLGVGITAAWLDHEAQRSCCSRLSISVLDCRSF